MATAAITVLSLPCQSPHFPQLKWFINNFLPRERERSSYCTPLPWISFSPSQTLKSFDHQYRSALHRVIFSWIVRKPIICPATGRARLNLSGPTCVKRRVERMKTIMMSWAISLISDMLPRVVPAHYWRVEGSRERERERAYHSLLTTAGLSIQCHISALTSYVNTQHSSNTTTHTLNHNHPTTQHQEIKHNGN